jgi:hypothetical protein
VLATNKTIDFKTRTVEDLSDTLSVLFYLHPTQRPLHAIYILRFCAAHIASSPQTRLVRRSSPFYLVRLVDRLTQRFLLCHFRRGTRNRMLPLARCAIAALQHRTLTSLWPSSSQPRRLGGPCGVGYTAAQAWPCEPPHFPHHSLAGQGSRQRGGFPAYLSGSVAAEGASP